MNLWWATSENGEYFIFWTASTRKQSRLARFFLWLAMKIDRVPNA